MFPVEPESGDDRGFGVLLFHKVDNGLFDTFDTRLVKSKKPALETSMVNECCMEIERTHIDVSIATGTLKMSFQNELGRYTKVIPAALNS